MHACQNNGKGCGKWFESLYGRRVHLRSCEYGSNYQETGSYDETEKRITLTNGGTVRIDHNAADEHSPTEREMIYEQDVDISTEKVNDLTLSRKINERDHHEKTKLVNLLMLKLERMGRRTSKHDVNSIISILVNPSLSLRELVLRCRNYDDCVKEQEIQRQTAFGELGFEKVEIIDPESQFSCYIYTRSPIKVLQEQISDATNPSTIFNREESPSQEPYSHPMTAELGISAIGAVRKEIMSQNKKEVMWHDIGTSFETSFVGLVQLYSDKSQNSLKASSFHFYPLHITLLNFSEEHRRKCIVGGKTFLAFLPVEFYERSDGETSQGTGPKFGRDQRLRMLKFAIKTVLKDLIDAAYTGFQCKDGKGVARRCHPCIASYCCDLPESKDLISVKNGNRGTRNCHRCMAETDKFSTYTRCPMRNGEDTHSIIMNAVTMRRNGRRASAETLLKRFSLSEQLPIMEGFPFMNAHPSLDIHSIFMVEPLHEFHLGVSRDLKKCASERLRAENIFTHSIPTKKGIARVNTFKQVRMTILNGVNKMLAHIQKTSPSNGFRIDFSKKDKEDSGNGLFNGKGNLMGMLEAKDYKTLDMVSPFIGMFLDRCCDEVDLAPTTSLFVQYVQIMQSALSYDTCAPWTSGRIDVIESQIENFKEDAKKLYKVYHPTGLCTEKFHMLDHIPFDLRRAGGLRYGDAGLYEYSHTLVKNAYRSGSKRRANAMDETMALFQKEMNQKKLEQNHTIVEQKRTSLNRASKRRKLSIEVFQNDCAGLVDKGANITLSELRKARQYLRMVRKSNEKSDEERSSRLKSFIQSIGVNSLNLAQDVGEDGSRILHKQLFKLLIKTQEKELVKYTSDYSIIRVASCYVSGIATPTLENYNSETNEIVLQSDSDRSLQRIISGTNFHGVPGLRQDCVLIEGNSQNSEGAPVLWVGKALALLRLRKRSREGCGHEIGDTENVFVQYFDALPPQDSIDRKLKCIRLQWARDNAAEDDVSNNCQPMKWFDLLPASSIRGRVQVIRGDYGKDGLCATQNIEEVPWFKQFFYINRFYLDPVHRHNPHGSK